MIPLDRLEQISQRFQFLEASMSAGSDGADYADLKPVIEQINVYKQLTRDITEAEAMLADAEMAELAREELPALKEALPKAEAALQVALLPKDAADAKPAMLEIRPGTGGDEPTGRGYSYGYLLSRCPVVRANDRPSAVRRR